MTAAFLLGSALTLMCIQVRAEESGRISSPLIAGPVLAYASIPAPIRHDIIDFPSRQTHSRVETKLPAPQTFSFTTGMTLAGANSELKRDESESFSDEAYDAELLSQPEAELRGFLAEGTVVLFRTRLGTRFTYRSLARIHSGYGQVFTSPDTIGRSRSNGAGVDDPSCLYLKLSLSF